MYNEGGKKINKLKIGAFLDKQEIWYKNTLDKSIAQLNIVLCESFSVYSLQPMYIFLGNEQEENL